MAKTVADQVVSRLHAWGVRRVYGYPGDGINGVMAALDRASELAGVRDVAIGGGADVIRQALAAGRVDELVISTAPVILGAGKRLFEGFDQDIDLRTVKAVGSPYATHVRYAVVR